jgi:hypothetical protein
MFCGRHRARRSGRDLGAAILAGFARPPPIRNRAGLMPSAAGGLVCLVGRAEAGCRRWLIFAVRDGDVQRARFLPL